MSQIKKIDSALDVEGVCPLHYPFQHPFESLESYQMTNEFVSPGEQRFSAIFNQSSHFMALLNLDGTVLEANHMLLDFVGMSANEILGQRFWETRWWAEASEAPLQAAIAQAAQGRSVESETELLGKGDRVLTIDFTLKPIRDEAGKALWLLAEGRAIPQRQPDPQHQPASQHQPAIGIALQERDRFFETIANLSPVGIFRMNGLGEMVYANDRWREITGSPASVSLEQAWRSALHADDRSRVFAEWEAACQLRQPYSTECRFLRPDGSIVWVLGQVIPEFAEDGTAISYVGTLTDISDRKQVEEDLKDSERRYATLTKLSSVGISRTNAEGDRVYVNDRWGEIAGLSPQDALAQGWKEAVHPGDAAQILPKWEAAFRQRQPFFCECRFLHSSGETRWVIAQALPDIAEDDKFLGYVSTITDITDRKQSEMELQERADELSQVNHLLTRTSALLEERNRELDQFAYVTSHDLKAPLRAIANLSEWIEDDLAGTLPAENQRQMELLRGRVYRMESLIDGLLQYSRVGRTQVETETVSVQTLLTEIVDSIDPPETFTVAIGEGMPTLQAKSLLLRQVFANLIGNAIKHHPRSDGQMNVMVQDQGLFYEFAVSDDGRGIAAEHHDKIFNIFHTLEARDTKESTGIGLSIVKKIVETEGGSIRVESQVGDGTTFRFTWLKHPKVQ